MCLGNPAGDADPAAILARAIKDALGADVNPEALRTFIKCRWDTIAIAAHKIHGSLPPAQEPALCVEDPTWDWWLKLPPGHRGAMVKHYHALVKGLV